MQKVKTGTNNVGQWVLIPGRGFLVKEFIDDFLDLDLNHQEKWAEWARKGGILVLDTTEKINKHGVFMNEVYKKSLAWSNEVNGIKFYALNYCAIKGGK